MTQASDIDPRGLIREGYRIEGITEAECRSIFLDWALSEAGEDLQDRIAVLLARHGDAGHPMTAVLEAGLREAGPARRRGGRAGRSAGD